ncbi:MAG: hypothetical protein PUI24_02235 [Spirochaetales bacterium]|nr:hypothetical protein [Spirochaetales bacterium]
MQLFFISPGVLDHKLQLMPTKLHISPHSSFLQPAAKVKVPASLQAPLVKQTLPRKNKGGGTVKVRLNVAKPGVKIGALMPLHTVCGMGTILFVAYATATNRAFLHPTSAPSAFVLSRRNIRNIGTIEFLYKKGYTSCDIK